MSEIEVPINGTIVNVEVKQTRNDTDWFTIMVEVDETQYPVKAFGKMAVAFADSKAAVGDNIKTTCRLESREWQGKYFLDLVVENIKVAKTKGSCGKNNTFVSEPKRGDDNQVGEYSGGNVGRPENDPIDEEDLPF